MFRAEPIIFQSGLLKCRDVTRNVLALYERETVYAYVMKTGAKRSLLVSPELLHPHLYFLRTIIANYQGALSDATETLTSHGIDIREYHGAVIGNVATWNACLSFPKNVDVFETRKAIERELGQRCGAIPPIGFFFVEKFPFLGTIEESQHEVYIAPDFEIKLEGTTLNDLGIAWDTEKPSVAISTSLDVFPGIMFYFIPPEVRLLDCELVMNDRVGTLRQLLKAVSEHIDLVASNGVTIRFGNRAKWKFYGSITGDKDLLKERLLQLQGRALVKISRFNEITTRSLENTK